MLFSHYALTVKLARLNHHVATRVINKVIKSCRPHLEQLRVTRTPLTEVCSTCIMQINIGNVPTPDNLSSPSVVRFIIYVILFGMQPTVFHDAIYFAGIEKLHYC